MSKKKVFYVISDESEQFGMYTAPKVWLRQKAKNKWVVWWPHSAQTKRDKTTVDELVKNYIPIKSKDYPGWRWKEYVVVKAYDKFGEH